MSIILGLLIGFLVGALFILFCFWWSHIDTATEQSVHLTAIAVGGLALIAGIVIGKLWFGA